MEEGNLMASTLKDIADLAGVSVSTASIVMRGNGSKRKISDATQQKVLAAAKSLNYTPDMRAKALRSGFSGTAVVTLFWATDIRLQMLSRFIQGLQAAPDGSRCEIMIKTYENDHLREALTDGTLRGCNGIIICNPSGSDMDYLEQNNFPVPIVLYNRYSKKYSAVHMDDRIIGQYPAFVFAKHGRKYPAILKAPSTFGGMNVRTSIFEEQAVSSGMYSPVIIDVENSMDGGYQGIDLLLSHVTECDCLFCTSDYIALGALKALHRHQVAVPKQLEIISVGNAYPDLSRYSIPSLSVMSLPMEEMAAACLMILCQHITSFDTAVISQQLEVRYIARESCGE
jgi:LacI family transcriptional regulator